MKRRSLVAALGTAAITSLAGCNVLSDDEPPAGSLQIENHHDLPHTVRMIITDVGSDGITTDDGYDVRGDVTVPPSQRRLQSSISLSPNKIKTFETIFTEPVTYAVVFAVDDAVTETAYPFSPRRSSPGSYAYLNAEVYADGEFSASFATTGLSGPFTN
ncbi:MAG: hypothetical protein J07HX5_01202 [halophilic archaeon J07HX5]|jgi:hypothetical protein|nr:MAG: hypothetical protein J07HX5_01202 [halophilic archaeon J07HX5]